MVFSMQQYCPICDSDNVIKILNWMKGYNILKCNHCKLIFSEPLPSDVDLHDFYQGFCYNKPDITRINNEVKKRKVDLTKLFGWNLPVDVKNNHFLDFGGGSGVATKAAKELGLDAHYFEIDEESISFVKNVLEIDDNHIFTHICDVQHKKFDCIFSDNVIEHYKFPIEFIDTLYNLLKSRGVLIIKTPHASNTEAVFYPRINIRGYFLRSLKYNSFKNSIYGYINRWWHCDPPRHIYSFSKESFKEIAKKLKIHDYEIDFYRIPLFKYSIAELILTKSKNLKGILIRLLLLPILPIELISKLIQLLLIKLEIISPGGIILKIWK
jgi:2-polyprenyl-3-methyl-5-hydroxy-6-metoxy-1,4-benzoquinol methylase